MLILKVNTKFYLKLKLLPTLKIQANAIVYKYVEMKMKHKYPYCNIIITIIMKSY